MIKVRIKEMAIKRGFTTAYKLQKAMDLQPAHAYKLFSNSIKMIGLDTLDSLCEILDCIPSDLLIHTSSRVKARKTVTEPAKAKETASNGYSYPDFLTPKQLGDEIGLSRKRINDYITSSELKAVKGKQNHNFISRAEADRFKVEWLRSK